MKTYDNIVPPRQILWEPLPQDLKEKPRPPPRAHKESSVEIEMRKHQERYKQSFDLQKETQFQRGNFTPPIYYSMGDDLAHPSVDVASLDTPKAAPRGNGNVISPITSPEQKDPTVKPKPKYAWQISTPNQEVDELTLPNPDVLSGNSMRTRTGIYPTRYDDEHSLKISESKETLPKNMQKDIVPNTNYEWKRTSQKHELENDVYTPSYTLPASRSSGSEEKQSQKKIIYTSDELLKFRPSQSKTTTKQNSLIGDNESLMSDDSGKRFQSLSGLPKSDTQKQSLRSPIDIDISLDLKNLDLKEAQVAVSRPDEEEQRETGQNTGQSSLAGQPRSVGPVASQTRTHLQRCQKGECHIR
jgi:hypothetical protein